MNSSQEKELRELLSYAVDSKAAYFSGYYGPRKKCLIDKKGNFPSGLIYIIETWFKTKGFGTIHDIRTKPKVNYNSKSAVLEGAYDSQKDAFRAALRAGRGTISMPTGTGKSRVIGMIAGCMSLKTLVVVPTLEIKKQLEKTLEPFLNITIENIDSPTLKQFTDFDCLIIDEAHHVAAKTYHKLNKTVWKSIYYRFFFTATPFRNNTEETLLFESIAGRVIYSLDYKQSIKNKYIVPVEAYYLELVKQPTDAYNWAEVYKELVVTNVSRNIMICNLMTNLHSAGKHTLCLVKEVAHGNKLAEITGLPFVSGADADSRRYIEQFNKGNIKVLIGTTGILGEGVDTKPCEYVIIAGLGKAKSHFMQQIGRAVRNYPGKESAKIILIKDRSHKFCSRHFKEQCNILKDEYGVMPVKLEIK